MVDATKNQEDSEMTDMTVEVSDDGSSAEEESKSRSL